MNAKSDLILQPSPNDAPSELLAMIERIASNPEIPIERLERLLDMQKGVAAKMAETDFDQAMSAAQGEMGRVSADSNNPQTRSKYASYGQLDRHVRPIYTRHGFSLSFGSVPGAAPGMLRVTCRVAHRGGHSREYAIDMPADGKGAKGGDVMTLTHATGAAASYGMRYLLKMIFNIAVGENDNDGNAPTIAKITDSQAADLDALIQEVGANKERFCKFYKIAKLGDLAASDLAGAVAELNRKRK
jgi:hypothetical protein